MNKAALIGQAVWNGLHFLPVSHRERFGPDDHAPGGRLVLPAAAHLFRHGNTQRRARLPAARDAKRAPARERCGRRGGKVGGRKGTGLDRGSSPRPPPTVER